MSEAEKLSDRELDMRLFAGLEVLKSQQTEINRRIGILERRIESSFVEPKRVEALEEWREEATAPTPLGSYVMQAIGWGVGITILATLGAAFGLEMKW